MADTSEQDVALKHSENTSPLCTPASPASTDSKLVLPDIKCYILIATAILQSNDPHLLLELAGRILCISSYGILRFTSVINTLRLLLSFASCGLSIEIIAQFLQALTPCDVSITSLNTPILISVHPSLDNLAFLDAEIDPLDPQDSFLQDSARLNHSLDRLIVNGPVNDNDNDTPLEYSSWDPKIVTAIDDLITWLQQKTNLVLDSVPVPALVASARDVCSDASQRCNARMYWPEPSDLPIQSRCRFLRAMAAVVPLNRDPIAILGPILAICPGNPAWKAWARGQARPYSRSITSNSRSEFSAFIAAAHKHNVQFHMLAEQLDLDVPQFICRIAIPLARYHGQDYAPLLTWLFESGPHIGSPNQFQCWTESLKVLSHKAVSPQAFVQFASRYLASIYFWSWQNILSPPNFDQILAGLHVCANGLERCDPQPFSDIWQVPSILDPIPQFDTFAAFYQLATNPLRSLFEVDTVSNGIDCALASVTTCRQISKWHKMGLAQYLDFTLNTDPLPALDAARSLVTQAVAVDDQSWRELLACVSILVDSHGSEGRESVSSAIYECLLNCNLFSAVSSTRNDGSWPISPHKFYTILHDRLWLSLSHSNLASALMHANECLRLMETTKPDLADDQANQVSRLESLLGVLSKLQNFKVTLDRKAVAPPAIAIHMRTFIHSATDEQRHAVSILLNTILSNNPLSYKQSQQLDEIANGLFGYFAIANTNPDAGVASACVEAALADEDFDFAYSQALVLAKEPQAWITVYQVANFLPSGDDENVRDRIDRLLKQRDLLGRALASASETGSTDALLRQWCNLNAEIEEFYTQESPQDRARETMPAGYNDSTQSSGFESGILSSLEHVGPSLYTAANPAGEKLQNLLISGLGWAIGAQRPH